LNKKHQSERKMNIEILKKGHRSFFVKSIYGEKGRAYSSEPLVEGKVPVYLVDDQFLPLQNEEGKPKITYYPPQALKIIGYFD
jgi:hypothetical protein